MMMVMIRKGKSGNQIGNSGSFNLNRSDFCLEIARVRMNVTC